MVINLSSFSEKQEMDEETFRATKEILNNKRIIIADDNGGILKWLKFSLQDYGATVDVFKHGQETIDFLIEHQEEIDVLVLDLIMNDLGGLEIAKENKKLKRPVFTLFITGCSPDKPQYIAAKELGTILQKPIGVFGIVQEIITGIKH